MRIQPRLLAVNSTWQTLTGSLPFTFAAVFRIAGGQMTRATPSLDPSGIALALLRVGVTLNGIFGSRLTSLTYHQPDHIGEKVPFLLGELTIYGFGFSGSLVPLYGR